MPGAELEARIGGVWGQSTGCVGCWGAEGGVRVRSVWPPTAGM